MAHETLVEIAIEALNDVHSDTSVSLEQTLNSLEVLRDHIHMLITAIEEDLRNQ